MKKILILTGKVNGNRRNFMRFVGKNIKAESNAIFLGGINKTIIEIGNGKPIVLVNGENVSNFDLIYFRGVGSENYLLATSLALCFTKLGVKFFDTIYGKAGASRNKLASLVELGLNGINIPHSIYIAGKYSKEQFGLLSLKLGLPFVAKDLSIQKGRGVTLVRAPEDLENLPKIKSHQLVGKYLFQKFIERDREYRVLVLGEKVGVWEEKIPVNDTEFRANVALGATEEFMDLKNIPTEIADVSIKASKIIGIEVAGVDVTIAKNTGEIYVLEVNRGPGFTYGVSSPEFSALASFLEEEAEK